MRTLLAALTAVLTFALAPATAAHADDEHPDDEVVPDVTLSVQSIVLDPMRGGTQTVRVVADTPVPVRVYVDDLHYSTINGTLTIQRGTNKCNSGAPCSGSGDVSITYHAIDKYSASLTNDGKAIRVRVMAYTHSSAPSTEYIARAEGTTTLRYEFDASLTWMRDAVYASDPDRPQIVLSWRIAGPLLLDIGVLEPTIFLRIKGMGSYRRIVSDSVNPAKCAAEGSDIVCTSEYTTSRSLGFVLASCPRQDITIAISTDFYDPNPGNNNVHIPASAHMCAQNGAAGGSGGGSGSGAGGGGTGAGSPSTGPSDAPTSSPASASAPASPARSGNTTSLGAVAPVSGSGSGALWAGVAAVLGALLLVSAVGGWWFWRRRTGTPAPAPTTETSD